MGLRDPNCLPIVGEACCFGSYGSSHDGSTKGLHREVRLPRQVPRTAARRVRPEHVSSYLRWVLCVPRRSGCPQIVPVDRAMSGGASTSCWSLGWKSLAASSQGCSAHHAKLCRVTRTPPISGQELVLVGQQPWRIGCCSMAHSQQRPLHRHMQGRLESGGDQTDGGHASADERRILPSGRWEVRPGPH